MNLVLGLRAWNLAPPAAMVGGCESIGQIEITPAQLKLNGDVQKNDHAK